MVASGGTINLLSPKERLLAKLSGKKTDRPPVICTGGMMNAAIVDIMTKTNQTLPEAHLDASLMANLAAVIFERTGFENLGVPFCMTVEAEVLGSEISYGSLACEPKIVKEAYANLAEVRPKKIQDMMRDGRIQKVISAAQILAHRYPEVPVIGNLTGPVSTAASLVDPVSLLRAFRKRPAECHQLMEYVTDLLINFATELTESGATLISIADPTATGEILGPTVFKEYAVGYINKIINTLSQRKVPVIVHICGNMNTVRHLIPELRANAISTDAMVNLQKLKYDYPQLTTMGNVSTYLLEFGSVERVCATTRRLIADGIDIISPACGLSTSTPLSLLKAMTETVKEAH